MAARATSSEQFTQQIWAGRHSEKGLRQFGPTVRR